MAKRFIYVTVGFEVDEDDPKCKSMDTLDTEALTVLSLDELRKKYPWVNWKVE